MTRRASVTALVVALVVAQMCVWLAVFWDAFFKVDDFVYFTGAQRSGGWSWEWLGSIQYQHFAPLHRAAWLLLDHATPGAWAVLLLVEAAMLAAGLLLFYATLRLLFGESRRLLVAVALVGLTPQLAIAFAWPSHGLQALPEFLAQMAALYGFLMYVHTRRARWLVFAAAGLAFGLMFYIRTLFVLGVVAIVRYVWIEPSLRPRELGRAVWRDRWAWLALGAPAVAYAVYYVARDAFGEALPIDGNALEQYVRILWLRNVWPRTLGVVMGPGELSTFQVAAEVAAQVLLVATVAFTLARKPAAWRAWLLVAVVLAATVWMTASGRLGELGPAIGSDHRYVTHLPWVIALAVLFALHPRRHLVLGAPWPAGTARSRLALVIAAGATAAVLVASVDSIVDADADFGGAAARDYVENLRESSQGLAATRSGRPRLTQGRASSILEGGYALTRADIVTSTGVPVAVGEGIVPDAVLADDGRVLPADYEVVRSFDLGTAPGAVEGGTWNPTDGGWCLTGAGAVATLTVTLDPLPPPDGETFIDAHVLRPGRIPMSLDPGSGLPIDPHTEIHSTRPGRVATPTGAVALRAFRLYATPERPACLASLGAAVLTPRP